MNVTEWIRQSILDFIGTQKLPENPNSTRLTYINDDEAIKKDQIKANRIWYIGDGDELLNYYTYQDMTGFAANPIYNRNKRNYFWGLSASECDIKRVHSGMPNAIVTTLTNVIGYPQIKEPTGIWEKVEAENEFKVKLTQQARPLTLAEGYGAWKVNFNKQLSDKPIWEYYEADAVEYIYKQGLLVGIIFKSYYKDKKNQDYILLETRYKANGNSYIKYDLFRLSKSSNDDITPVDLNCLPELCDLPKEPLVIEGLNKVLGVPSRYFYDPLNAKYGQSLFSGKLDLFDELDELWSQLAQAIRQSGVITWINSDLIERGANGKLGLPEVYNRKFMMKAGVPDGEGNMNQDIITEQPNIYFDKYIDAIIRTIDNILIGRLSPATMGFDVAKKDNAEAQREKEKITILTRNNIIAAETNQLRDIVDLSIKMQEYMDSSTITLEDYNIDIKYDEFANPSEESMLQVLVPVLTQGAITPELFVDKLYGDSLDDEAKAKEIQWIKDNLQQGEDNIDRLLGGDLDVPTTNNSLRESSQDQDTVDIPEE